MEYRMECGAKDEEFRGMGLTSRRNMCIHPEVRTSQSVLLSPLTSLGVGEQGEEREACRFEVSGLDFCVCMREGEGKPR